MVNWKVILVVIAIGILFMVIGMWLGYRYISEQDEIIPRAQHEPSDALTPLVLAHLPTKKSVETMLLF